jgi:predicted small metal-binding protein
MDKLLSCWNITEKCYFVVQDESEEEALRKIAEHAEKAHSITFTKEMREKAKSLIRKAA